MPVFLGFLGVLAFSFTLPATRVAVEELDPTFVGIGREAIAAVLAGGDPDGRASAAAHAAAARPDRDRRVRRRVRLAAVHRARAPGLTSAHSAVIVGILPRPRPWSAVLRAGEHPTRGFWLASLAGLVAVLVFAATQGAGVSTGDVQILVAVALAAIGYAEGGALAREMGGWRVICWAVFLSAPLTVPDRRDRRARLAISTPAATRGSASPTSP